MVAGIKLAGSRIGVDGVRYLVVAALVQTAEIEPNFGDIWIDTDCPRVCVECVAELIDLEVQNTD